MQHQLLDFDVAFDAGVAVDLGADLQRLARAHHAGGQGVQHAAGIAQALTTPWRFSRCASMRATCGVMSARTPSMRPDKLVDQLEGPQIESCPVPVSSDSTYSSSGGITSW